MSYSNLLKKTLICLFYILLFLVALEITLTILGDFYSRKVPFKKILASKGYTIICLGDSFTYGFGVDILDTYPKQLESKLNAGGLGRHFEVFNLGIPGANSSQQLKYFQEILQRHIKPELVILLAGANDSWNMAESNIYKFKGKVNRIESFWIKLNTIVSRLKIYKLVKLSALNLKISLPAESRSDLFQIIPQHEKVDTAVLRKLVENNLIEIINLARANHVKIILQNYPRGDIYESNILQATASRMRVPFMDNYSAFNERLKECDFKEIFLYDLSHPNREGYKIMVDGLYGIITKEIL